ncbi:MAG: hypothetical protein NW237_09815 [Cyanobacteriota bacterium]|nr:hypothetical protein [Cyanobacteriota bacterium]
MGEEIPYQTLLSKNVSVADYLQMEKEKDKPKIIEFIKLRFTERYITPLRCDPKLKHGFCTMAICCLMIETLESFWQGWDNSRSRSKLAFCSFFARNQNLSAFQGYAESFYKNVRCGILHQAETMDGWHIRRDGSLFEVKTKTINATSFHNEMENCLEYYCLTLEKEDWNSETWSNFRKKMQAIISHCG